MQTEHAAPDKYESVLMQKTTVGRSFKTGLLNATPLPYTLYPTTQKHKKIEAVSLEQKRTWSEKIELWCMAQFESAISLLTYHPLSIPLHIFVWTFAAVLLGAPEDHILISNCTNWKDDLRTTLIFHVPVSWCGKVDMRYIPLGINLIIFLILFVLVIATRWTWARLYFGLHLYEEPYHKRAVRAGIALCVFVVVVWVHLTQLGTIARPDMDIAYKSLWICINYMRILLLQIKTYASFGFQYMMEMKKYGT
jgi:hypothetical protein